MSKTKTHPSLILFALAMGGFAIGTTEFATMSLLPYFSKDLNIDAPTAGHVISAYALGVVIGAPLIAILAAKLPRKTLLIGLMITFAVANVLSGFAPTYNWLLLFRFLSGLPHGVYFGIASLVAASLVPPNRRGSAVARMFLGLTIATIIGVPAANWIGQAIGWRWGFGLVGLLAILTVILVSIFAPNDSVHPDASPFRELGALKKKQVWLTLGIGAIGSGGFFAVYTYLASTLLTVTNTSPRIVPIILAIFGIGMTFGTLIGARAADRAVMPTIGWVLVWNIIMLAIYPFTTSNIWAISIIILFIGSGVGLATAVQVRLMDIAGDAQALAAALNHSAFNCANALGPFLGGLAISAGYGFSSTGWVGSLLAFLGFIIWFISLKLE